MTERFNQLKALSNRLGRVVDSVLQNERSGDADFLLSRGHVEKLVREGRTPIRIGRMGTSNKDGKHVWQSLYQVPPKGFKPENTKKIYTSNGAYVFVDNHGIQRIGPTYPLNRKQMAEVNRRIKSELKKIEDKK
jgi:hypothetical protein